MAERKVDMAVTTFNPTPEGILEFDNGRARNLDTKDFGQIVLEEKFVKGKSISDMNRNGVDDRSR